MAGCDALPRLFVRVIEGSERRKCPPLAPPMRHLLCKLDGVTLVTISQNVCVSAFIYILQAIFPTWFHFLYKFIIYFYIA